MSPNNNRIDSAFMPNAALLIIPPLLFGSEAAERLNIKTNPLAGKDGVLKDSVCGVFINSADQPDRTDRVYIALRAYEPSDRDLMVELTDNKYYITHFRTFIRNIGYTVFVFHKTDRISRVIDTLESKPLSCLPLDDIGLIRWFWKDSPGNADILEEDNHAGLFSMRYDFMPKTGLYEFNWLNNWVPDKKYYSRKKWMYEVRDINYGRIQENSQCSEQDREASEGQQEPVL
ncbi:hypothetical protein AGMMS50239_38890 [Bacteroidia bacterium]|nr:hypothetical protein AGMMS50239_38890 [Bacteroidia bacterium]